MIIKKKIKRRLKWLRTHIPKCARHTHTQKLKLQTQRKKNTETSFNNHTDRHRDAQSDRQTETNGGEMWSGRCGLKGGVWCYVCRVGICKCVAIRCCLGKGNVCVWGGN